MVIVTLTSDTRKMSVITPENSFGFSEYSANPEELWVNHTV